MNESCQCLLCIDTNRLEFMFTGNRSIRYNPKDKKYFLSWISDNGVESCDENDHDTPRDAIDFMMKKVIPYDKSEKGVE